jgi:hypothetical protein
MKSAVGLKRAGLKKAGYPPRGPDISLEEKFIKKLRESGLHKKKSEYGFKLCDRPSWNAQYLLPGIEIPYYDIDGKRKSFCRYRYLQDTRSGLELLTDKKPVRYVQPSGSPVEIYLPPTVDWKNLPQDSAIIITEGELKAACAVEYGYAAVAVGGVYSFRKKESDLILHDDILALGMEGRTVYIIYDSDARYNTDVVRAENRLAECILQSGGVPYVVRLPELEPGKKCGIDDYLVGGGDLDKVLEESEPYGPWAALQKLNERFVFVQNPLCVVEIDNTEVKMEPGKFVAYHYGHLKHNSTITTPQGDIKVVQLRTAKAWMEWSHRRESRTISYKPGSAPILDDGTINEWRGWGVEPKIGDVSLWNEFLSYMFASEPEYKAWFEQWLAYPLQVPGAKLLSACVFWGATQGTGKSMIGEIMSKIYGNNAAKLDTATLEDSRNEWAVNKQFAFGDEITGSDRRGVADRLKGLITQSTIRVNMKFVPSYSLPDCINYYFTSNHPDAFYMDTGDRRYFIHEVRGPKKSMDFYKKFVHWWRDGDGASQIFYHLLNVDLKDFNPADPPPVTIAKAQMIAIGRSDLAEWVSMVREEPDHVLRIGDQKLGYALWSAQELLAIYDPSNEKKVTPNGMARELRRQGFLQVSLGRPVTCGDGHQRRLWAIRKQAEHLLSESQTMASEYYDAERTRKNRTKVEEERAVPTKPKRRGKK